MFVRELKLQNFRSYDEVAVHFTPGINVLVGTNGQGKTNLVEAIHYLATFESHRVSSDVPLVKQDKEYATAEVVVDEGRIAGDHARQISLSLDIIPGKANRARLNGAPLPKNRSLLGSLQTVVFAPEDLALVKGDPSERRKFLDDTLTQIRPGYQAIRADFDRVLRQRNALLKSGQYHHDVDFLRTLEVWDGQLAKVGGQVLAARLDLVQQLIAPVRDAYTRVSADRGPLEISYETSLEIGNEASEELCEAALLNAFAGSRKNEIDRGITLVGPHRDELAVNLRGLPVRGYASHGESWSAALALKLAVYRLLQTSSRYGDPVLILDDVFAELDEIRRDRLVQEVKDCEQVIVTAAVRSDVPESLTGSLFDVFEGSVTRVS